MGCIDGTASKLWYCRVAIGLLYKRRYKRRYKYGKTSTFKRYLMSGMETYV